MTERLLSLCNPNHNIMVVPQEEGGAEGDNYFGSIGDATMKHVHSLDHGGRQMYQELIHMRSGNIYKMVSSVDAFDPDPMNMRGKDLKTYLDQIKKEVKKNTGVELTEADLVAYQEAIEVEFERREQSEDALDQEIIPYADWEKHPQMWSKIDIPTTPGDRAIYMGNTRDSFYDEFPDGHPDSDAIRSCINLVNKPWDRGLDPVDAETCKNVIRGRFSFSKPYVLRYMLDMVDEIAHDNNNADDYVINALLRIDHCWQTEYLNQACASALKQKMTRLLMHKEKEWEAKYQCGENVHKDIKAFGRMLFKEFKDQMTSFHWSRYKRARDKYAPRVLLQGLDLNRCGMSQLYSLVKDQEKARKIWFARPFASLEEALNSGHVSKDVFADDEKTEKVIEFIEKHAKIAKKNKDLKRLSDVRSILFNMQRAKKGNLSSSQWGLIWRYYKILRNDLMETING